MTARNESKVILIAIDDSTHCICQMGARLGEPECTPTASPYHAHITDSSEAGFMPSFSHVSCEGCRESTTHPVGTPDWHSPQNRGIRYDLHIPTNRA